MARDTSKLVTIPGELHSAATGNIVTSTEEVFDYTANKYQKDINQEIDYIKAIGYYECSTPGSTAAKTITTDSSVFLSTKILCKVKFVEKNTANNATMNINGTGEKDLYYNGVRVAANNSWYPNEVVDLYYDGTNYQAKSCADTLEYDVSLHQTHEITEIITTIRTLIFNGDVASNWESETPVSDSSVESYTRTESNTGQDVDSTTTEGPYATYDSTEDKTNVVYITTHTYTHVVNNYTFDEAVNAVPMSYRHGGLQLRFISNSVSGQSSDNIYVQHRYMGTSISDADFTNVANWQGVDEEPIAGSKNLVESGGSMNKLSFLYNKLMDLFINDATCRETSEDGLFICDEQGYAAINLFDLDSPIEFKSVSGDGFVICDEQGYVYIDFSKGIKTKTWDGNYLYPSTNINRGTTDLTGCINKSYDMIHTKWPTAQVFVCSIMKMGRTMADATWSYLRHNESDQSYNQYNKRIRECAELAGFTFIDLWGEMSIDPLNMTQAPIYFHNAQEIADRGVDPSRINDRLHPIQAGHERIAKVIYNHLVNANGADSWQGKKAIFFGDSITDNLNGQHTDKVYYSYLTDWLQLKDDGMNPNGYSTKNTVHYPQNAGAYGTGYMLEWEGQGNLYERIPNYNNDYDLVVIMLGVNDFQEPLGEIYNY